MKKIISTVMCIALSSLACFGSSTKVRPSPLNATKQKQLRCTLMGSWQLTSIDGDDTEGRTFIQSWTFSPNNKGLYEQKKGSDATTSQMVVEGKNPFVWSLDGRNIKLSLNNGDTKTFYRADKWSDDTMTWFNYTLSNMYTIKRTSDGDYSTCMEEARPVAGDQTPATTKPIEPASTTPSTSSPTPKTTKEAPTTP